MSVQPAIQIDQVKKVYGNPTAGVTALHGVSLDIQDQEFFTLLGPSGCGKTTLLRLIAGFEQPTQGEILLFGDHLEGLEPNERPVNTVFQQYSLFPHMNIAENIGFGLKMQGQPAAKITAVVNRMLALVKMEDFAGRMPHQLSGGQQQRIALARALAPQPKVLLLDEPLSALDLKLRQAMRFELKRLQRETGITFVFVTHDQEEAMAMSDRIAVMSQGRVQQLGTPRDIYQHPANRFVADFIGDSNLLEAQVESQQGDQRVCRYGDFCFPIESTSNVMIGDKVTLAIRPESIHLTPPGEATVRGRIEDITYLGADTLLRVRIGDHNCLDVRCQNGVLAGLSPQVGDETGLHITEGAAAVLAD